MPADYGHADGREVHSLVSGRAGCRSDRSVTLSFPLQAAFLRRHVDCWSHAASDPHQGSRLLATSAVGKFSVTLHAALANTPVQPAVPLGMVTLACCRVAQAATAQRLRLSSKPTRFFCTCTRTQTATTSVTSSSSSSTASKPAQLLPVSNTSSS